MQTFKNWLTEGEEKVRTMILYHGVRNPDNVKKIIEGGFKLIYVQPRWVNDYAVSAAKSKSAVRKFFGKDVVVLKFKFRGNVWKSSDNFDALSSYINSFASRPQDFTRDVIRAGIDASDQGYVYIYNPSKISDIEIA